MIVKWLVPPCPPCTRNIEIQTDREVVPELQEASAGPSTAEYIGVVISRVFLIITLELCCFSCMAQEGGESNLLDSDADGLGKMPIETPSCR